MGRMVAIAICCNLLIGYGVHKGEAKGTLLHVERGYDHEYAHEAYHNSPVLHEGCVILHER